MSIRQVEAIIKPGTPHFVGDGFRVHNFIPGDYRLSMQRMNPIIMMDYNALHYFEPSEKPRGVGVHPHRGFETVTIAYKGRIEHHDSSGGGGIIGEGDVQWMTAAGGVLHKEFHEKQWSREGGAFQMVQLWVNLPARDKMRKPRYQSIENRNMERYVLPDQMGAVEIIAGHFKGLQGSASTFTPLHLYNLKLKAGAKLDLHFPEHYNTALLVIEGAIRINQQSEAPGDHFVLMANKGEDFEVEATTETTVLLLSGEPIQEPIAAHGPFVMNTRQELIEAFNDFNQGKFGYLEE